MIWEDVVTDWTAGRLTYLDSGLDSWVGDDARQIRRLRMIRGKNGIWRV